MPPPVPAGGKRRRSRSGRERFHGCGPCRSRREGRMRRGDLVTVAMPEDFGKPRPALVVQSDQFEATATLTTLLLSGTLVDAPLIRLTVHPTPGNGLRKPSQIMVDKAMT